MCGIAASPFARLNTACESTASGEPTSVEGLRLFEVLHPVMPPGDANRHTVTERKPPALYSFNADSQPDLPAMLK